MNIIYIIVFAWILWKLAFRKKKEDKDGCFVRIVKGLLKVFGIILVFFLFVSLSSEPQSESSPSVPVVTQSPVQTASADPATPTPTKTQKPTPSPTPTPTPEPTTLQGWAEYIAQKEFRKNLISVSCVQVDGDSAPMIDIYAKYPNTFYGSNDERMSGFLFNVMNVNWELAELAKAGKIEYGSVFIHGRTNFVDNYGNETEGDAAQIRIKASEAAKVNWSYSTVTGDMMPGISVSFGIHPIIREGLSAEYYKSIRK